MHPHLPDSLCPGFRKLCNPLYFWKDYTVKMTLGHLEKELDERFYRIGRSSLVNLTKIRRVTKTQVVLEDGTLLPLPRGAYEGVNQAIIHMR